MAARPKAGDKPAEGQATETQKPSVEEASKALNEALAQADPADAEQPKPAEAGKAEEAEKPAPKKLGLSEIRGEVKDGEKVYIGVEIWGGANMGGTQNAPFVVPKTWKIVGPASRPQNVHAMNPELPDKTLCRLPTNWTSGIREYPDDTWITCEPCARRLIAVKKLTQDDHDKRKKEAQEARDAARKALMERKAAEQATKEAKEQAASAAQAGEKAEPEAEAPAVAPQPEAKPDPKPTTTRKRSGTRRQRRAATK